MDTNLLIIDVTFITFSFLLALYNFALFLINKEDTTPLKLMAFILIAGVVRTFLKGDAGIYFFPTILEPEKTRIWTFAGPIATLGLLYFLATVAKPWKRLLPIYQIFVVLFCLWVVFVLGCPKKVNN